MKELKDISNNLKPDIILILLPRGKSPLYCILNYFFILINVVALKRMCEIELGQLTNCFNAAKALKANPMYYSNCALKICAKLGGTPFALHDPHGFKTPTANNSSTTMVIGVDVYHAPPMSNAPSIAAVVGSYDKFCTKFYTEIRYQKGRCESVLDMKDCVISIIKNYCMKNEKKLPSQIFYFRDGVGSSFFDTTISHEVGAIKEAFKFFNPNANVLVTYVNVQKRHHTVFFPKNKSDCDRNGNVLAGTLIDTVVCDPRDCDFYLYSHASIIGTSKSTHNHVLLNEANYKMQDIQNLCYRFAHIYQRCPRSVSIPAPVYYAHHAASRAKCYWNDTDDNRSVSSKGGGSFVVTDKDRKAIILQGPRVQEKIKSCLYYC